MSAGGLAGASFGEPSGVDSGLRAVGHAELGEQVGDVVLDRLLGEEHLLGDLAVGETVGEMSEDGRLLRRDDARQASRGGLRRRSSTRAVATGSSNDCPAATLRTLSISSAPRTSFST